MPIEADPGQAWIAHMRRGDFESAWAVGDRELSRPPAPDAFTRPRHLQRIWDGRPIEGRRVLVRCYHGLGDTIQFARFLPVLAQRAASVVVWAQPALIPLLSTMQAPLELLPLHDGVPEADYDVDVEIMELPWLLRTTLATLPRDVPYLHVDPVTSLDPASLNVAVVWRAGTWNAARSMAADDASSLADVPGVACFATEPRSAAADLEGWRGHWQPCDSVDALARFVAGVDLVVSVDTMCAHLAGALGVPVWTLLACDADWRWMIDRDDSPWYPTMQLFRQATPGSWELPLAAVRHRLQHATATRLPLRQRRRQPEGA
jgi:hypothetical protein